MDLAKLKAVAPLIDAEIKQVFAKFGLEVTNRRANTETNTGVLKWNLTLADRNLKDKQGNSVTPEEVRWKQYHNLYGLREEYLHQTFYSAGKPYKIMGLRDSFRTDKVVVAEYNGRNYIFNYHDVKKILERDATKMAAELRK